MTQTAFKEGPPISALPPQEAPKRRGRPPGSKNKTTKTSLKNEIGGTLTVLNMAVAMTPFRGDALDPIEIQALTEALDEQCKISPTFRRYVEIATKSVTGGGSLVGVVAIIGMRRVARHGIIPRQMDSQLGSLLSLSVGKLPAQPAQPFAPQPKPQESNTESALD